MPSSSIPPLILPAHQHPGSSRSLGLPLLPGSPTHSHKQPGKCEPDPVPGRPKPLCLPSHDLLHLPTSQKPVHPALCCLEHPSPSSLTIQGSTQISPNSPQTPAACPPFLMWHLVPYPEWRLPSEIALVVSSHVILHLQGWGISFTVCARAWHTLGAH